MTTAEEIIEAAIQDGFFDDLPGLGRPLDLAANPFAGDAELAHRLLKNNDLTLPWIADRKMILKRIQEFRDSLSRHREIVCIEETAGAGPLRRTRATGYLEQRQAEIEELNAMIAELNLKQPGDNLEILKLTLEDELNRAALNNRLP